MPNLNSKPTLTDIQNYVSKLEKERGFTENTVLQNALMLGEEIGELFKSIRVAEKIEVDSNSVVSKIEEELADVLIYIYSIANRYEIDLERAFRDKEEINKGRTWSV